MTDPTPPHRSLMEGLQADTDRATDRPSRRPRPPQHPRSARRIVLPAVAIVLLLTAAGITWWSLGGGPDLAGVTQQRTLIDSVTGEVFLDYRLPANSALPVRNPKTGTDTLYPVTECHWTADGKAKWKPTYVYIPYDVDQVTCPDCGRAVVPRNPRPSDELMLEALERHNAGG